MRYLYILPFFILILAIGIYYISMEIFRPLGYAISRTVQPKKLISNLDYVILGEELSNNDLILTIKLFGNLSKDFCIEDIKVNNISKGFEYYELLSDVYRIKIDNIKSYNTIQIRLCNGFFIEEYD